MLKMMPIIMMTFVCVLPEMCSGLVWMFPGLSGLPAEARSTSKPWSARHSSSSSRRENSSPGRRCRLHTEHRKHSMWYTLSRALITRSLLQKPMLHFAHLMPNNLGKLERTRRNWRGQVPCYIIFFHLFSFFSFSNNASCTSPFPPSFLPCIVSFTVSLPVSDEASAGLVQILAALCTLEAGCVPLQVRGDSQDVLVVYLTSTAHTHGDSRLLCVRVEERCINANTVCAHFFCA